MKTALCLPVKKTVSSLIKFFLFIFALFVFTTLCQASVTTYERFASDLPIKTSGYQTNKTGWTLNQNGYISDEVTFPKSGAYTFATLAKGVKYKRAWPQLELRVAGERLAKIKINSPKDKKYSGKFFIPAGTYDVSLHLINEELQQRKLTISLVSIQGAYGVSIKNR